MSMSCFKEKAVDAPEKLHLANYEISSDDAALISECTVTTFRSSGKGGQHVNKTDSAVRIRHEKSGIVVTCQRERSQYLNKKNCLEKLRVKLERIMEEKPPRISTKIPKAKKIKRRVEKKLQGQKKTLRQKPLSDE
jgi:protein subunit release factor B